MSDLLLPPTAPRTNAADHQPGTPVPAAAVPYLTQAMVNWYTLSCFVYLTGYFGKNVMKKALEEAGRAQRTNAEIFWYIIQNIRFGSGYLSKVPIKKALEEAGLMQCTRAERRWYIALNVLFGAGYLNKVLVKKALEESNLASTTSAERGWYVAQCVFFGYGYIAKTSYNKALSEVLWQPGNPPLPQKKWYMFVAGALLLLALQILHGNAASNTNNLSPQGLVATTHILRN